GRSVTNASTNEAAVRRAFRAHRALVIDRQAASHEPLAVPTPRRGRSRVSLRAASFGVPRLGPRSPEAGCTELAYGLQDALHVRIRESERLRPGRRPGPVHEATPRDDQGGHRSGGLCKAGWLLEEGVGGSGGSRVRDHEGDAGP